MSSLLKHLSLILAKVAKLKQKTLGGLSHLVASRFFFGPLIGSSLADSKLVPWFHYDTPFWAAALLVAIGFLTVLFFFKETRIPDPEMPINVKKIFLSFVEGIQLPRLSTLFSAHLFIFCSMFFFLNFFSAFLVSRFDFTIIQLGQANAYLSLFLIFSPVIFKQFARYFPPHPNIDHWNAMSWH